MRIRLRARSVGGFGQIGCLNFRITGLGCPGLGVESLGSTVGVLK